MASSNFELKLPSDLQQKIFDCLTFFPPYPGTCLSMHDHAGALRNMHIRYLLQQESQ